MSKFENKGQVLEVIHKYYPIGITYLNDKYSGFAEYNQILANKINSIIENQPNNFSSFLNDLGNNADYKILNLSYVQFPAYKAVVELDVWEKGPILYNKSLIIIVSLLYNACTVFINEKCRFKERKEKFLPPTDVISLMSEENKKLKAFALEVINKLQVQFPLHEFINHDLLFTTIQGGIPYYDNFGQQEKPYPIYNYLFDLDLEIGKAIILQ